MVSSKIFALFLSYYLSFLNFGKVAVLQHVTKLKHSKILSIWLPYSAIFLFFSENVYFGHISRRPIEARKNIWILKGKYNVNILKSSALKVALCLYLFLYLYKVVRRIISFCKFKELSKMHLRILLRFFTGSLNSKEL